MITLRDFFGMTGDEQKIVVFYDDTVEQHKVYEGYNIATKTKLAIVSTRNDYIRDSENYIVVIIEAVNNVIRLVIMEKSDYEQEVKRHDKR